MSRPSDALNRAEILLISGPSELDASYAHQAIGIVLRERGDIGGALRRLRLAAHCASAAGVSDRISDTGATLGATLVMAGHSREGLDRLDHALQLARGGMTARVRLRRAHALGLLGRPAQALADLDRVVEVTRRNGDMIWEARGLLNRCVIQIALGRPNRARADALEAARLFDQVGQELESGHAVHTLGVLDHLSGDLPAALRHLDAASERYVKLGESVPELMLDRTQVLLAAGLRDEAWTNVEQAWTHFGVDTRQVRTTPLIAGEVMLQRAVTAVAVGRFALARSTASRAARMFVRHGRPLWTARARLVEAQARHLTGERPSRRLTQLMETVAAELAAFRADEAAEAHLLAGQLALARDDTEAARRAMSAAAGLRHKGPPLSRTAGWLGLALIAEIDGRPRQLRAACRRGLDALDEHRLLYGAELRAHASSHGYALAQLGLRDSLRRGTAQDLLTWSERWRATALSVPAVRPPDDPALTSALAAYREATRQANQARMEGRSAETAERDRVAWEVEIRRRRRHEHGTPGEVHGFRLAHLVDALGSARLVSLVEVDGHLWRLVVHRGRVRRSLVGPADTARREVEFAQFALRRAAFGRPAQLGQVGGRLEQRLLGTGIGDDDPIIVVPSGRLHDVPWGLLPSLRHRPFVVAPSAGSWLQAMSRQAPSDSRVAVVVAPGLSTGYVEADTLAVLHPTATVLTGKAATVGATSTAIDGAFIAHLGAHGRFRADSPLFSCLYLADGPLTVHDLDRLHRPPHLVVLSACESAAAAPVGNEDLLGLVTGLLGLGSRAVVAGVGPVNDRSTVPVMRALHEALSCGATMAESMLAARQHATGGAEAAAAATFVPWGA